jgi:hypothetical protein
MTIAMPSKSGEVIIPKEWHYVLMNLNLAIWVAGSRPKAYEILCSALRNDTTMAGRIKMSVRAIELFDCLLMLKDSTLRQVSSGACQTFASPVYRRASIGQRFDPLALKNRLKKSWKTAK